MSFVCLAYASCLLDQYDAEQLDAAFDKVEQRHSSEGLDLLTLINLAPFSSSQLSDELTMGHKLVHELSESGHTLFYSYLAALGYSYLAALGAP